MQYSSPSPRVRPAPRRRAAAATTAPVPTWALAVRALLAALAAVLLTLLAVSRLAAQSNASGVPRASAPARADAPDPTLSAEDVVTIVLDALSQNDRPTKDHGIEVTFAFTSPANRAMVGPLDRFGELVREEAYRPLLYHHNAVRGPMKIAGDRATQRVIITTATGERVAYTFTLTLQTDGPFKGCWMTEGVTREPRSALRAPNYAAAPGPPPGAAVRRRA